VEVCFLNLFRTTGRVQLRKSERLCLKFVWIAVCLNQPFTELDSLIEKKTGLTRHPVLVFCLFVFKKMSVIMELVKTKRSMKVKCEFEHGSDCASHCGGNDTEL